MSMSAHLIVCRRAGLTTTAIALLLLSGCGATADEPQTESAASTQGGSGPVAGAMASASAGAATMSGASSGTVPVQTSMTGAGPTSSVPQQMPSIASAGAGAMADDGLDAGMPSMPGEGGDVTNIDTIMPDAGSVETQGPDSQVAEEEPAEAPREDLGEGDGSDVIAIGDSWMNLGATGIQQSLNRASGQRYRTYGVPGTRLLNDQIPGQYDSAKRANSEIKTVVMTGGGNDIIQVPGLRDDCDAGGDRCAEVVDDILNTLTELWAQMAADGVQDVVYVQYCNPEGNNVDFAQPDGDSVKKRCDEVMAPMRCHTLETLDIVMGEIPDGIHPSGPAYDRIGEAVYDLMVEQGMRR